MTFFFGRDDHYSRKHGRHLHGGKIYLFFSFFGIFSGKKCSDVQCLVTDQRKWSGRIHCHGCQNRIYIILKIPVYKFLLFLRKCLMLKDHMKSCFFKGRNQRPV